jgi:copper chaperone CopZ
MKQIYIFITLSLLFFFLPVYAKTIEVEVHGMTCAFCVDSLERKFNEMDSVSNIEVSLKTNKVRLEMDDSLNHEIIKQTIIDAGFTPIKITEIAN